MDRYEEAQNWIELATNGLNSEFCLLPDQVIFFVQSGRKKQIHHHSCVHNHYIHLVEVAVFVSVVHTEHDWKKGTFSHIWGDIKYCMDALEICGFKSTRLYSINLDVKIAFEIPSSKYFKWWWSHLYIIIKLWTFAWKKSNPEN